MADKNNDCKKIENNHSRSGYYKAKGMTEDKTVYIAYSKVKETLTGEAYDSDGNRLKTCD